MNLAQELGALLIVGFHGTSVEEPGVMAVLDQIRNGLVGGVCLFAYNIESPAQLSALNAALHEAAGERPFFIFVDQEGGKVERLTEEKGFQSFSSPKALGASGEGVVQESSLSMAEILKAHGFNANFAPCIDVDQDPPCPVIGALDRSYADSAEGVSTAARAFIEGHHQAGVLSCVKHFPGHGSARGDSHYGMTDITECWTTEELEPYRSLAASDDIDLVMTAHLVHRERAAGENPATLSPEWIDCLRNDVGYAGAVITDDLHMGAILQHYGEVEAGVGALKAGVDLLLYSNNPMGAQGVPDFEVNPEIAPMLIEGLTQAVEAGSLSRERITEARQRVEKLWARTLKISSGMEG